jgi:signal peptide peptidase SppA
MSDIPIHRIAGRFFNKPLFLMPETAEVISAVLLQRFTAGASAGGGESDAGETHQLFAPTRTEGGFEVHKPRASRFHGDYALGEDGRPLPYRRTQEGTAIITLVGEFVNRGSWVGASSGLISYEGFKHQMRAAGADPKTRNIVLDIESPGGEAVGAFEAAETVREVAAKKNVIAVVNGMAASAAYAIASGARQIVVMPTGIAGSIGVVMLHLDLSKALADRGIKPTLIFAGDHKVDGNPYEALPEAVREDFQRECDSFYAQFVDCVASGRKGMSKDAIRATQARVFKGQDAVDTGLADTVGTLEEVLAELSGGQSRLNPQSEPKGPLMTITTGAAAAAAAESPTFSSAAELAAAFPDFAATLRTEGATAERERITAIQALARPGRETLIEAAVKDGKSTKEQVALQIVGAEDQKQRGALSAIKGVEDVAAKIEPAPTAAGDTSPTKASDPDGWKAEWAQNASLKEEFPTADLYVGYMQGVASGKVRRLSSIPDRKAS